MILPALATVAGFLGLLILLSAAHAARLLGEGPAPPRPRRFWLTLVLVREVGTLGAAGAAAWAAVIGGSLPVWGAALAAGAAAFLASEVCAPALGLALPAGMANAAEVWVQRFVGVVRRAIERPGIVVATAIAGEAGLPPVSFLHFPADGLLAEDEEAVLDPPGRELLARVRALQQRPVRAVMTPRVRVMSLPIDIGARALLDALREQRFSRIPVYRGDRDNVVGILYAKDLLGRDIEAPGFRLEPLLRPPLFVPVGMRAGDVFRELRRLKVHVGLVVDEYGGIAGLVTMEDLLEELFGEIRDEYDEAEGP